MLSKQKLRNHNIAEMRKQISTIIEDLKKMNQSMLTVKTEEEETKTLKMYSTIIKNDAIILYYQSILL